MWTLNSAIVQSFVTHVMLKRDAAATWMITYEMWRLRRKRLRSGRETPTDELEKQFQDQHGPKPRAMSHLQFRIHLCKRWATPPGQTLRHGHSQRTAGRPQVSSVPVRSVGRKSKPTTSTGGPRKRRAGRTDSVKRLTTHGGDYDLESLARFRGQRTMPGVHIR